MNELLKNYDELVKVSNHNHIKSDKDAVEPPKNMFNAFLDAGYEVIGITDHGCFAGMQTMIDLAKKSGKKILYGCEAYVEVPGYEISDICAHMIFYAENEEGKTILVKLISKAAGIGRVGQPVVLWDDLVKAAKTHTLVCTTACISGLPSIYLLSHLRFEKKINALKQKQQKLSTEIPENTQAHPNPYNLPAIISPENEEYKAVKLELKDIDEQIAKCQTKINDKAIKDAIKLIKADIRVAVKAGDSDKVSELTKKLEHLEADIANSKTKLATLKKKRSEIVSRYKIYADKVEKWIDIDKKISDYGELISPESERIIEAKKSIKVLNNLFGQGKFFIEVQNHGMDEEKYAYRILAKIGNELNIPLIAANDSHMAKNTEESLAKRNVARFLRFLNINESEADKEMYIKTPNELATALLDILTPEQVDESMMNLNKLNELCTYEPVYTAHYPVFDKSKDSNELLRKLAYDGVKWKYPNNKGWDEEHIKRLEYELDVICKMGFADYHLIVKDFLEYGRLCGKVPANRLSEVPLTIEGAKAFVEKNGWKVGLGIGVGRGSGAGSLVCFVLGITNIDPFKFGLIFERFLNPERVSMPDIDSDLSIGVREKTIEYVKAKYGSDAVVGILTETREGVKGSIRDAARYLGKKELDDDKAYLSLGSSIRKKIETAPGLTWDTNISENLTVYELLLNDYANNDLATRIIKLSKQIEGMLCGYGQHAAGVIIYDDKDITDYIPTRKSNLGRTTECDMIQAEAIKLLKMDFLGLKTLNILTDTFKLIQENHGVEIQAEDIPLEGPEAQQVYKDIFAKGRTKNVFQFESPGMRKYLKELMAK